MTLAATVGIAVLGAYLFYRMKVPAGALIGAILFTAIFNIMTGMGTFPTAMKTVVQAIAGGFIGQRITRGDLKEMKTILGAKSADVFLHGGGYRCRGLPDVPIFGAGSGDGSGGRHARRA